MPKVRYKSLILQAGKKPKPSNGPIAHNTPFVPDEQELKRMEFKLDRARQLQVDNYLDLENRPEEPPRVTIANASRDQVVDALYKIKVR